MKALQGIWGWRVAASCPVQKRGWQRQTAFVILKLRDTWKRTLFSPFLAAGTLSMQNVQILGMGLFLGGLGLPPCELKKGSGFLVLRKEGFSFLVFPWFCLPPPTVFCLPLAVLLYTGIMKWSKVKATNLVPQKWQHGDKNKWVSEGGRERGKAEVSAAEGRDRDHHAKGDSWPGEHLGIQSFVGEAIADCLESAALLRIVLFCFSPTAFEGVGLILTQEKSCRIQRYSSSLWVSELPCIVPTQETEIFVLIPCLKG